MKSGSKPARKPRERKPEVIRAEEWALKEVLAYNPIEHGEYGECEAPPVGVSDSQAVAALYAAIRSAGVEYGVSAQEGVFQLIARKRGRE